MCNVFWAGIAALCGAGVWAVSHNPDTIVTGGGSAQPALGEINAHVTRYNTQHRVHTNIQHTTHNTRYNTQHRVHTNIQTYSHNEYLSVRALAAGRPALVWEDGGAGAGAGALIAASLRTPTSSSLSSSLQLVILASNLSWLYYHISELYCTYCLLSGANCDFFSDVNRSICDIYSIPVYSQEPFNLNITHINCFWLIFFSQTTCNSWPSTL